MPDNNEYLFDAELVEQVIINLSRGKAAGLDGFVGIQDGGRENGNIAISQYTWCDSSNLTKVMTQFCSHCSGEVIRVQKT